MIPDKINPFFIHFNKRLLNEMIIEASNWPEKETGGMMFGKIIEKNSIIEIYISKTYIPSENYSTRERTYFEIDPEYQKKILNNEQLLYLGSWHKHLGYGGPSYGDHRQVEEFFTVNPHKKIVLAVILDFISGEDYDLIIEVYKKDEDHENPNLLINANYQTYLINKDNINFYPEDNTVLNGETWISKLDIPNIKQELVKTFDNYFTLEEIQELNGSSPGEKIISFPFQFTVKTNEEFNTIELIVLISFPPEFPNGEIYIDISSKDLSKNFTIEKHPASLLDEKELIEPFFLFLKATLEDETPKLLEKPLWKVMR